MNHLVYLSKLIKAYLKVTFLAIISEMMNKYHLKYLNELLKGLEYLDDLIE